MSMDVKQRVWVKIMKSQNNSNVGDTYIILSRYGQKFNLSQVMNNKIDPLTSQKWRELKDEGYDVDAYDDEIDKLNKEALEKLNGANIWEREKITLEYNKKRID